MSNGCFRLAENSPSFLVSMGAILQSLQSREDVFSKLAICQKFDHVDLTTVWTVFSQTGSRPACFFIALGALEFQEVETKLD